MVILITGSSSGIGETIARRLFEDGHCVSLMARRADLLEAIVGDLDPDGTGKVLAVPGDVGSWEDCMSSVSETVEAFGRLDGLVNAAGTWVEEPLIQASPDDIQRFVNTDVSGAIQITRASLAHLKEAGSGRLIHLNGLQGFIRQRPPVLYAAVESAVRGLTESLRWEAAEYGVHVGLISLGSVANTEPPSPEGSALSNDEGRLSLSRDEVSDAVIFMLSRAPGVNVDEIILTPLRQRL